MTDLPLPPLPEDPSGSCTVDDGPHEPSGGRITHEDDGYSAEQMQAYAREYGRMVADIPAPATQTEPVAWRFKQRINGEFDSDWILTKYEPADGVCIIAKEPLYTAAGVTGLFQSF